MIVYLRCKKDIITPGHRNLATGTEKSGTCRLYSNTSALTWMYWMSLVVMVI
jgi:hypothetical protein